MFLTKEQIDKSINWLLENSSTPVLYLTHRHILNTSGDTDMMRGLWCKVQSSSDITEIFSKQNRDGSWFASGTWAAKIKPLQFGYNPETPKYMTTIWILPHLGDLGFTIQDERIHRACHYVLTYQVGSNPTYRIFNERDYYPDQSTFGPCRFSQYLISFAKVCLHDSRVTKGYDILLGSQRKDGGWVASGCLRTKGWTRSCPASTFGCTYALYCRKEQYHEPLIRALNFLNWHLSTKQDSDLRRFWYHGHSTVHEMLMFSEYGIALEGRPVRTILDWLMSMYLPDTGSFRYIGKPISKLKFRTDAVSSRVAKYRFYHLIEDDWLTYYMTRIAINLCNIKGEAF
jgi:hypothetical protein